MQLPKFHSGLSTGYLPKIPIIFDEISGILKTLSTNGYTTHEVKRIFFSW